MTMITFHQVGKVYPDGTRAVRNFNLQIAGGELIVFVGPSGGGKPTALRMVAGLEDITEGTISIGERVINDIEPRDRDVAMVFQNYALYPHMSVYNNIAFPLRLMGMPRDERDLRVRRIARLLGLEEHLKRRPGQLSGGQRQRVAMGRAIVREPRAFLMDEPLSNLDAKLRVQVRAEISSLQQELGVTTIYVTHDQVEAMTIGSRVAVLRGGELQQVAEPQALYDRPVNLFVAGFIGSPPMNLVEARITEMNGTFTADLGSQSLTVLAEERAAGPELRQYVGRRLVLGVRPERLEDAALVSEVPEGRSLRGYTAVRESLGSDALVHFIVDGTSALSGEVRALAHDVEDPAELEELEKEQGGVSFVGRFEPDTRVKAGDAVSVFVWPGGLQFFDPETGRALGVHP